MHRHTWILVCLTLTRVYSTLAWVCLHITCVCATLAKVCPTLETGTQVDVHRVADGRETRRHAAHRPEVQVLVHIPKPQTLHPET